MKNNNAMTCKLRDPATNLGVTTNLWGATNVSTPEQFNNSRATVVVTVDNSGPPSML